MGGPRPIGTALLPGARLGRYELVQSVAVGGMAEIYLARTQGPQRFEKYVILKRILPHLAAHESFVEMFLEEARLVASMNHSNIVQVHDFGEADGSYFFTMEYVHGEDVRTIMKTLRKRGSKLKLADAITIISHVAAGLHYAHEMDGPDGNPLGVVHRDVSPSNVLVAYDGTVKITDFGIAKATQSQDSTRSGTVKGKVSYMSPEQCDGAELDRRSDVFALAIVLFEITTGKKLFTGANDLAVMRRIIDKDATKPSSVDPSYPPALEKIVMRGLSRDPARRHATTLEFQIEIERFCAQQGLVVSSPSLAATMLDLFGKRQHPWHGQRQPSVITMEADAPDWDRDSQPSTSNAPSKTSLSSVASEVALLPPAPKRRSFAWLAFVLVAVVGVGVAAFVVRQDSKQPEPTPASAAPAIATPPAPAPEPPPTPAAVEPPPAPPVEAPVAVEPPPESPPAPVKDEPRSPTISAVKKPVKKPTKIAKPVAKPVAKPAVKPPPAKPAEPPKPAEPKRDINSPFLPR